MEKDENYYLPLHWQPFNPETTDMDDYFEV